MKPLPCCVLYTQEAEFAERMSGLLQNAVKMAPLDTPNHLELQLRQTGPTLLLMDLRSDHSITLLQQIQTVSPQTILIALGNLHSDPMREAEMLGIFAAEDLKIEPHRFRRLIARALDHLELTIQNQLLREENFKLAAHHSNGIGLPKTEKGANPLPLRHLFRAFRHFDKLEILLDSIVEGVAATTMVSRVGIFSWTRRCGHYRLRAGLRCFEETQKVEYLKTDPFVHWLQIHARLISRSMLEHVKDPSERMLLKQRLDTYGAEVIIPLQARSRLLGWLFVGHRATGVPFDHGDLEDLMIVAEHVSTNLENALLYEEAAVQKTLLETLFHSMPTGIVAVDIDGTIQWFNKAAQKLLSMATHEMVNQPIKNLDSRIADLFLRTLKGEKAAGPSQWTDPITKRALSVQAECLMDKGVGMGAVAVFEDQTAEQMLREKQEQLERTVFWTELAASMSHQIRNPLVAIRTFAQLLPERYDDPEFRNEFWKLVPNEIDRLNQIINLIHNFAHPPDLIFKPLDLKRTIQYAMDLARLQLQTHSVKIDLTLEGDLPPVKGDENAIAECLSHLFNNAVEAVADIDQPQIQLQVKALKGPTNNIAISIQDNGRGIPPEIRDKVFSPFCSTKPTGMGLGLPIVKRTVLDHNGQVHIDTSSKGTSVTIMLPCIIEESL